MSGFLCRDDAEEGAASSRTQNICRSKELASLTRGDPGGDKGVVMAIRPHHSSRGQCSCGWVGKPRLLLSAAKCDALVHAAECDCQPAIPLVQPEPVNALQPSGMLVVECPAGCGATFSVPVVLTDTPSVSSDEGELSVRFTAEVPELHDHIYKHLRTCVSARSWVDSALHDSTSARPRRIG